MVNFNHFLPLRRKDAEETILRPSFSAALRLSARDIFSPAEPRIFSYKEQSGSWGAAS